MTTDINALAVLAAALAVFALGSIYYGVLGERLARVSAAAAAERAPAPWQIAVEFLRGLVLAVVVAGLAAQGGIDEWNTGLALGLALWVGFPLVLWTGAIVHERTPIALASIHAGDWLLKLAVVAVIVSVWQ